MEAEVLHNENELRLRLQAGEEEAFSRIVHHYYPRLFPYVLKITKTHHTAEEIVQEVFLRLWQNKSEAGNIEHLRSWLFRVASNLAFTFIKRASMEGRILQHLQYVADKEENDVEAFLDYRESALQLDAAIEQLPEQQRLVFKLRRQEGLNNQEIAQRLNISPNTVKNHLARALQTLRKSIGSSNLILISLYILFRR